jgi:hypothetical protein
MPDSTHDERKCNFFVNLSQGVQRRAWGPIGTFCSSSVWYSYEFDLVLSGYMMLRAHGVPINKDIQHKMTNSQMRDLAGESFSLPCVAAVVTAFYLNPWGAWWREDS